MRFLLDECIPKSSIQIIKSFKYSAISSKEANLLGKADKSYIDYSIKSNRILITLDVDFANTLIYNPYITPGIIVLRPKYPTSPLKINKLLYRALKKLKNISINNSLVIISENKIRIRRY